MRSLLRGLPRSSWRQLSRRLARPTAAAAGALACGLAWPSGPLPERRLCACDALPESGRPKFLFCARTETYTPVFTASASANTASVNVNGALLRNYARSTGNVGMKEDVYDRLYSLMLRQAQAAPGRLQSAADAPKGAAAAARDLGFVGSFARVPGQSSSSRGAAGAVFIDVYSPAHRPLCDKNVALIYVEGPNGNWEAAGRGVLGVERPAIDGRADFLQAVEDMASNLMLAVREYNGLSEPGGRGAPPPPLPRIEVLQVCLVSGGSFKHPEASKLEVAQAIVQGLLAGCSGGSDDARQCPPTLQFAYDEDTFRTAVEAVLGKLR